MPNIDEVFATFPNKEFLIHVKDGNLETYKVLWEKLNTMPENQLQKITVYGDDNGIEHLRNQSTSLRLLSMSMLKSALLQYELIGFTGYIPEVIRNMELHLPLKYAKLLWGWPNKFIERMESVNSRVVVVAGDGKWSAGFDTKESLKLIPDNYSGYIWTNRIDRINAKP